MIDFVSSMLKRLPCREIEYLSILLDATGIVTIPDFLPPEVHQLLLSEARGYIKGKVPHRRFAAPYSDETDTSDTDWSFNGSNFIMVPGNEISPASIFWKLYHNEKFRDFLSALVSHRKLFDYDYPKASIELSALNKGHTNSWHFDRADIVVTIILMKNEKGGLFQMIPKRICQANRSSQDLKYVLSNAHDYLICPFHDERTMTIFAGREAVHRVSEVKSEDQRLCFHLGFSYQPGECLPEILRRTRYL